MIAKSYIVPNIAHPMFMYIQTFVCIVHSLWSIGTNSYNMQYIIPLCPNNALSETYSSNRRQRKEECQQIHKASWALLIFMSDFPSLPDTWWRYWQCLSGSTTPPRMQWYTQAPKIQKSWHLDNLDTQINFPVERLYMLCVTQRNTLNMQKVMFGLVLSGFY